jgi:DNA transposition AAA+ family ATPase
MISESKKSDIVAAVIREKQQLGSMNNVAKKLGISGATISHNLLKSENWRNVSETMWTDIASKLGLSLVDRNWNIVPTNNYKIMYRTLSEAQREGLFMAVTEKAGSGKTTAIRDYVRQSPDLSAYSLQCEAWSLKGFLISLSTQLGVENAKSSTVDALTEGIVKFLKQRTKEVMPLLVLDEADKLKPAALQFLIVLYNRLEDELGLVACGTDNLEKSIRRGVKNSTKGYDEIESRLGRSYIHLVGVSLEDVAMICQANGIDSQDTIRRVFTESGAARGYVGTKIVEIVKDLRAVKRKIKKELLLLRRSA